MLKNSKKSSSFQLSLGKHGQLTKLRIKRSMLFWYNRERREKKTTLKHGVLTNVFINTSNKVRQNKLTNNTQRRTVQNAFASLYNYTHMNCVCVCSRLRCKCVRVLCSRDDDGFHQQATTKSYSQTDTNTPIRNCSHTYTLIRIALSEHWKWKKKSTQDNTTQHTISYMYGSNTICDDQPQYPYRARKRA